MKKILFSYVLLALSPFLIAQNALNFDGTNDLVQTAYSGVLGTANRTFEARIFVSPSAPASNLAILDYGLNLAGQRNTFVVTGDRGLKFISGGTNANISSPANTVPVNQWVHVAFVLNNGTGYLYVDGNQVGTGSLTSVNTPNNEAVRVGQRVLGGSIPFKGSIDEVRIWDVARTASEIDDNQSNELCNLTSNLKLYLKLNEGNAGGVNTGVTTAIDDSDNGNNGTLSGFTLSGNTSNWVMGSGISSGGFVSNTTSQTACGSYMWSVNNQTYYTSGTYSDTINSLTGCDSIEVLDLTIGQSPDDVEVALTTCESYYWPLTQTTYDASGSYSELVTDANGCQYTVTLNLTVNQPSESYEVITNCGAYTWAADGQTYSTSGLYTTTLSNSLDCDSNLTLELYIESLDNAISQTNDSTLSANNANLNYQWLDCGNNFIPIPGETNQIFVASADGSYALEVSDGACVDTSACVDLEFLGLDDVFDELLQLYPNPTTGQINIDLSTPIESGIVSVTNLEGKRIYESTIENTSSIQLELSVDKGMYFIEIQTSASKTARFKVVVN